MTAPVIGSIREIQARREREQSIATEESEKQVRITFNGWPDGSDRPLILRWMEGKGHRPQVYTIQKGKSMVAPVGRAQAWLGPFAAFEEYALLDGRDERRAEKLLDFIAVETDRYLKTYDYPRESFRNMKETGHHRSPDVTVTILDADGTEHAPIRLQQIYEIGEWDPLKDQFGVHETVEEVKQRYKAQLDEQAVTHRTEMEALMREMLQLKGMMQGVLAVAGGTAQGAVVVEAPAEKAKGK